MPRKNIEIIAHRGASTDAPENTIAAVKLAWQQGADAVEMDVWVTSDKVVVAHHDKNTRRLCGVDLSIAGSTLQQLQQLDAGSWKSPQYAGEKIPSLEEVLAHIPSDKRIFVEIKCGPEVITPLEEILKRTDFPSSQIVFLGGGIETMRQLKVRLPHLCVLALFEFLPDHPHPRWAPCIDNCIQQTLAAGLDGLDLEHYHHEDIGWLPLARAQGLQVYAWVVDDGASADVLIEAGVQGLTTNTPDNLIHYLQTESKFKPVV